MMEPLLFFRYGSIFAESGLAGQPAESAPAMFPRKATEMSEDPNRQNDHRQPRENQLLLCEKRGLVVEQTRDEAARVEDELPGDEGVVFLNLARPFVEVADDLD